MLIASLPAHKKVLFDEKQVPLSRIQLDRRLAMLDDKDAALLLMIEQLLHWSHIAQEIDQEFLDVTLSEIDSCNNYIIKNLVIWRMDLRIILAALRLRHRGQTTPPAKAQFAFDKWFRIVHAHWQEPDMGLSSQFPWIAQVNRLLEMDESLQLEKYLLNLVWDHYRRLGQGHYFNFEAVVIYVLCWDIINRWTSYNREHALQRFNQLLQTELQKQVLG